MRLTPVAVDGPLFTTLIKYVIVPPAATGFGEAVMVTDKFAVPEAATRTTAVAELFVRTGSVLPDVTDAVSTICVPVGVAAPT